MPYCYQWVQITSPIWNCVFSPYKDLNAWQLRKRSKPWLSQFDEAVHSVTWVLWAGVSNAKQSPVYPLHSILLWDWLFKTEKCWMDPCYKLDLQTEWFHIPSYLTSLWHILVSLSFISPIICFYFLGRLDLFCEMECLAWTFAICL